MQKKDEKYFKDICHKLGWEFVKGKKHIKLKHPSGQIVSVASTASCYFYKFNVNRSIKQVLINKNEEYKIKLLKN